MKEFKTIDDVLDFAIGSEQEAVDFYSDLAKKVDNEEMKSTFLEFAQEEMQHKARLTKVKEEGVFNTETENIPDLKIADYTVSVKPSPDMNYQDALVLAMNKEKAAFKLYSKLAERAPNPELQQLFLNLAQEESKHKLRFELEYDEFVLREN